MDCSVRMDFSSNIKEEEPDDEGQLFLSEIEEDFPLVSIKKEIETTQKESDEIFFANLINGNELGNLSDLSDENEDDLKLKLSDEEISDEDYDQCKPINGNELGNLSDLSDENEDDLKLKLSDEEISDEDYDQCKPSPESPKTQCKPKCTPEQQEMLNEMKADFFYIENICKFTECKIKITHKKAKKIIQDRIPYNKVQL